jgi:diphthamide biosynthesis methyltransferase
VPLNTEHRTLKLNTETLGYDSHFFHSVSETNEAFSGLHLKLYHLFLYLQK